MVHNIYVVLFIIWSFVYLFAGYKLSAKILKNMFTADLTEWICIMFVGLIWLVIGVMMLLALKFF